MVLIRVRNFLTLRRWKLILCDFPAVGGDKVIKNSDGLRFAVRSQDPSF